MRRHADATTSELGVLGASAVRGEDFELLREPPSAELAELVERYWLVRWSLPPGRAATSTHLPHPCVNLVFDRGRLAVAGVGRERFDYPLAGEGRVFGVKFRPGAFHPFLRAPLTTITGQTRPLTALWPAGDVAAFAADLSAAPDLPALVAAAERHLRAHRPPPDPEVERVGRIVRALLHDRTVTRVEEAAARFGTSPRTLQRLFQRYVGVSPKWVLSRYRLHEAAARLAEGVAARGGWAAVAADLGYFDQPHFIRDFTRAVGLTPAAYAEACRARRAPVAA
ncbi:helix-turn-helix domain-containing protein [Rhizomonospora bruguierae]|uniref:helix-turn-helix domain-containing protein n=1 Tax=Rhizomonospora bruguierae TaxID=1581705 RepID=UPI001BCBB681|nr:AraC family transcriptional regulator [Micromonospora sp. NBRC 107566]